MSTKKKSLSVSYSRTSKPNREPNDANDGNRAGHAHEADRVAEALCKVQALLDAGDVKQALARVSALGSLPDLRLKNARGVCLMRTGCLDGAVRVFREFVLAPGGYLLRSDIPVIYKTNLATALLLSGNVSGGMDVLGEIRERTHPAVAKLLAAIGKWRAGLNPWQKLGWVLGTYTPQFIPLDFPPGDLS